MKSKISHILQILSPNILFLREGLHLTYIGFLWFLGKILMSVDSQSPEFKQGKRNVLCMSVLPKLPCSSPDPKFPIKSKASKWQLQNMNKV